MKLNDCFSYIYIYHHVLTRCLPIIEPCVVVGFKDSADIK